MLLGLISGYVPDLIRRDEGWVVSEPWGAGRLQRELVAGIYTQPFVSSAPISWAEEACATQLCEFVLPSTSPWPKHWPISSDLTKKRWAEWSSSTFWEMCRLQPCEFLSISLSLLGERWQKNPISFRHRFSGKCTPLQFGHHRSTFFGLLVSFVYFPSHKIIFVYFLSFYFTVTFTKLNATIITSLIQNYHWTGLSFPEWRNEHSSWTDQAASLSFIFILF